MVDISMGMRSDGREVQWCSHSTRKMIHTHLLLTSSDSNKNRARSLSNPLNHGHNPNIHLCVRVRRGL